MDDIIVIKTEDIIETRHNENDVTIKIKELSKLDYIPDKPKPRVDFQLFWEDFVMEFLSIDCINSLPTNKKQMLTEFLKNSMKRKLLKRYSY